MQELRSASFPTKISPQPFSIYIYIHTHTYIHTYVCFGISVVLGMNLWLHICQSGVLLLSHAPTRFHLIINEKCNFVMTRRDMGTIKAMLDHDSLGEELFLN